MKVSLQKVHYPIERWIYEFILNIVIDLKNKPIRIFINLIKKILGNMHIVIIMIITKHLSPIKIYFQNKNKMAKITFKKIIMDKLKKFLQINNKKQKILINLNKDR